MLSVAPWARLDEGELLAKSRHIDWAVWMKRTWGIDVMRCPTCSHRLRVVATIPERAMVSTILEPLQVRSPPLPRAKARDPTWVQESFEYGVYFLLGEEQLGLREVYIGEAEDVLVRLKDHVAKKVFWQEARERAQAQCYRAQSSARSSSIASNGTARTLAAPW